MSEKNAIELLSPARNLECGLAAISHGADAVYIGGPRFGAREAVGNPVKDIETLASRAHLFGAKVYVALNTILYDEELEQAQKLIVEIYHAGADALIIQDMGILEMDLPPIPLHASTQVHNYSPAKIDFLKKVGFKRAVLARELNLDQIREIRSQTTLELEAFVHGSLCVSLSGQCFLSQIIGGRSANRGACAQPCRRKYSLVDATGKILLESKHLLSLKDLNHAESFEELADAGVSSFKIEGRLKDVDYVKNITSLYRRKIDALLERRTCFQSASAGSTSFNFDPDPTKSFNRGSTDYFLHGRSRDIISFDSPKSFGEQLAHVSLVSKEFFELENPVSISNNDGLVFISKTEECCGLKVNKTEGRRIFPDKMNGLYRGALVYRNYDHEFRMKLESDQSERKIDVELTLKEFTDGFCIMAVDETSKEASIEYKTEKQPARDIPKSGELIRKQLSKSGDTIFRVTKVETNGNENYFFQASTLNLMRREVLEKLSSIRMQKAQSSKLIEPNSVPFPKEELQYQTNVSNRYARKFYQRHGVSDPGVAIEKMNSYQGVTVMTTKHCLKYQLGFCRKYHKTNEFSMNEPLYLINEKDRLLLEFDCVNCQMKIIWK